MEFTKLLKAGIKTPLPLMIDGTPVNTKQSKEAYGPDNLSPFYHYSLADEDDMEQVLRAAQNTYINFADWKKRSEKTSSRRNDEEKRFELIATLMADVGKSSVEADAEFRSH